jgi:hypothetical protein
MSDQPSDPKPPDDPVRRCDVLIGWVLVSVYVIWGGWISALAGLTVVAANAGLKVRESHPLDPGDHTSSNLTTAVAQAALQSTGFCLALPATLLLIVIWLQLRRLRKRLTQGG